MVRNRNSPDFLFSAIVSALRVRLWLSMGLLPVVAPETFLTYASNYEAVSLSRIAAFSMKMVS